MGALTMNAAETNLRLISKRKSYSLSTLAQTFLPPSASPAKMETSPKPPAPMLYHVRDRNTRSYACKKCLFTIRNRAEKPRNPCK